jgi:hypothetical protein
MIIIEKLDWRFFYSIYLLKMTGIIIRQISNVNAKVNFYSIIYTINIFAINVSICFLKKCH